MNAAVKGQEERHPSAAPLTAPQVTIGRLCANVGKQIKEGRHVGLDFYDLLIEALIDQLKAKPPGTATTISSRDRPSWARKIICSNGPTRV